MTSYPTSLAILTISDLCELIRSREINTFLFSVTKNALSSSRTWRFHVALTGSSCDGDLQLQSCCIIRCFWLTPSQHLQKVRMMIVGGFRSCGEIYLGTWDTHIYLIGMVRTVHLLWSLLHPTSRLWRVRCNSFDIVCVCVSVCVCVTTLTTKRTDIRTWISSCRLSGRISRSSL